MIIIKRIEKKIAVLFYIGYTHNFTHKCKNADMIYDVF